MQKLTLSLKQTQRAIDTIGIYHLSETHQQVGYYEDARLISVCSFPINSPFQEALVAGAKLLLVNYKYSL